MRQYLQEVATGPELSRSLSRQQAEDAARMIMEGRVDPVQAGIFLIALRMKRETDAENLGVLDALNTSMQTAITDCAELITITDPFNGFLRSLPVTPFLPAVLSACGLPACIHGARRIGPKLGLTPNLVLQAAGVAINLTPIQAAARLDDSDCGWAYLDQSMSVPALHDLAALRNLMVKRTCLSTLEVVMKPLSARRITHLMTGFVHKAYPPMYQLLAHQSGFDSALIVRGVEGGCIPSLSQLSRYFSSRSENGEMGELVLSKLVPGACAIHQSQRAVPIPEKFQGALNRVLDESPEDLMALAEYAANTGLEALQGQPGSMLESLVYGAAICLHHTSRAESIADGASIARQVIRSGQALSQFSGGRVVS